MYWIEGNGFLGICFMGFTFFTTKRDKAWLYNYAKLRIKNQQRAGRIWEECRREN